MEARERGLQDPLRTPILLADLRLALTQPRLELRTLHAQLGELPASAVLLTPNSRTMSDDEGRVGALGVMRCSPSSSGRRPRAGRCVMGGLRI